MPSNIPGTNNFPLQRNSFACSTVRTLGRKVIARPPGGSMRTVNCSPGTALPSIRGINGFHSGHASNRMNSPHTVSAGASISISVRISITNPRRRKRHTHQCRSQRAEHHEQEQAGAQRGHLRKKTDRRRTCKEPQVTEPADRGDASALVYSGDATTRSEDERNDRREAGARRGK